MEIVYAFVTMENYIPYMERLKSLYRISIIDCYYIGARDRKQ